MIKRELLKRMERIEQARWDETKALACLSYKFPAPSLNESTIKEMLLSLLDEFGVISVDDSIFPRIEDVICAYFLSRNAQVERSQAI